MVLDPLEVGTRELTVTAEGPIQVRLERGELIVEAARLATAGGVLEIEAWTELATGWQPGSPLEGLLQRFRIEANGAAPLALLQDFVDDIYTDGDLQVALSVSGTPEELSGEVRVHGLEAELRIADAEGVRLANPTLETVFEGDRIRVNRARLEIDEGEILAMGEIPVSTLSLCGTSNPDNRSSLWNP